MNLKGIFESINKAAKDSTKGNTWKVIFGTSIISFIGCLKTIRDIAGEYGIGLIVFGYIGAILFLFFLYRFLKFFIHHYSSVFKESLYGEAIITLSAAFSSVHLYRKTVFSDTQAELLESGKILLNFCNTLKDFFDKKTGSECCVSFVVMKQDFNSVEHLVWDSKHEYTRKTVILGTIDHKIALNTSYNKIYNTILTKAEDPLYYTNEHIAESKDYDNTCRQADQAGKLPFESELVIPIVPYKKKELTIKELGGFISVDCIKPFNFKSKYDIGMLQGVADGIYDLIIERNSKTYSKPN